MKRIKYIFLKTDSVLLGLISAIAFLGWGVILGLPFDTFASTPSYDAMASLWGEYVWAFLLLLVGGSQLEVTLRNRSWRTQAWVNFIGLFFWLFISVMIFLSNPISTGIAIYPIFALCAFGRFYRSNQDKERL